MNVTITDKLQKEAGEFEAEHDMFRKSIMQKSKIIAGKLGLDEVKEIELILVNSKSKFNSFLITQTTEFAIAIKEGENDQGVHQIMTIHPKMTGQLFQEPEKEYNVLLDYALLKVYLFEKYGKDANPMAGYFNKYALEMAAQILSDKFLSKIAQFEMKMYTPGKKFSKKELEVGILLYLMREESGKDFVYDNLDKVFEHCNPKKTLNEVYKKNFDDLILPIKEKLIAEARAEQDKRKKAWQDRKRLQQQVNLDKL